MGLREYRRKRDFSVTPEPAGERAARAGGSSFVVQKHAASRLHYDFRLEMEGVLKSWAVPKGPSLDPNDKRLAMETEDHPVEYGDFEGVIPEGEYGGGTVVVWDEGTWEPVGNPHQDYRRGALKFRLHGRKLRGGFTLVRIRGRDTGDDERSWLLVKEKDEQARPGYPLVEEEPDSVQTGRSLEQVKADRDRVWHSDRDAERTTPRTRRAPRTPERATEPALVPGSERRGFRGAKVLAGQHDPSKLEGARKGSLPEFVPPELATLVGHAPEGDEWLHEMKFDGYRILARLQRGRATLLSRRGQDWTARLEPVRQAIEALGAKAALVDGEAAVVRPDGTTSFQALQNLGRDGEREGDLAYFAFDLLHLDGWDLTGAPLEERKRLLHALLAPAEGRAGAVLRFSDHVLGSGPEFHAQACRAALEGVVSKRRDAPYRPGRGRDWVKAKCVREQEVVVAGFTPPEGSRAGLGALVVGVREAGRLRFAGKVGTGFTRASLVGLEERLRGLESKECPFARRPPGTARATWVRPVLVAEVAFTEWTSDGLLRHPSFKGLREDKTAAEVRREEPQPATSPAAAPRKTASRGRTTAGRTRPARARGEGAIEMEGVRLTHPDRVLYQEQGTTKRDLAEFYVAIAERMLPHVAGRPTTLVRCPEGVHEKCFYQKHTGYWAPESLRRVKIQEAKKVGEYLVVDDVAGLVGLVQIGILEIHVWNARADRLEQPDRLVFDLDPDPSVSWERVVEAAFAVRERLQRLDLESFVKTTGGKGLHVVVPLQRGPGWQETGGFAEALARALARERPDEYVAEMSKARRKGKIFLDYLRNHRGATSVAAYSTRAKPGAPVSTPLAWQELTPELRSDAFTVQTLPERLSGLKKDPWQGFDGVRQRLTASRRSALDPR